VTNLTIDLPDWGGFSPVAIAEALPALTTLGFIIKSLIPGWLSDGHRTEVQFTKVYSESNANDPQAFLETFDAAMPALHHLEKLFIEDAAQNNRWTYGTDWARVHVWHAQCPSLQDCS
jgi:hypothetical protein